MSIVQIKPIHMTQVKTRKYVKQYKYLLFVILYFQTFQKKAKNPLFYFS
jgi:hypothetical protein